MVGVRGSVGPMGSTVTTVVGGERVEAFVPKPLPPGRGVDLGRFLPVVCRAHWELGRLVELGARPDADCLPILFAAKEAGYSSRIEGIESSVSELLRWHFGLGAEGGNRPAVEETEAALEALDHGMDRIRADFPVSTRLVCEVHGVLLSGQRRKMPGEFRRSQNWIGGPRPGLARFVPPPPDRVPDLMSDLERFLHGKANLPPLLKAGLAHVQFETIHPFLDGNGRAGRALIALMLSETAVLDEPLLYLSRFFYEHRPEYYARLNAVRTEGDWEGWLGFFLQGVVDTARHARETADRLLSRMSEDEQRILPLGLAVPAVLKLFDFLRRQPFVSVPEAQEFLGGSRGQAAKTVDRLREVGVLVEITGRKRDRVFAYRRVLDILEERREERDERAGRDD